MMTKSVYLLWSFVEIIIQNERLSLINIWQQASLHLTGLYLVQWSHEDPVTGASAT